MAKDIFLDVQIDPKGVEKLIKILEAPSCKVGAFKGDPFQKMQAGLHVHSFDYQNKKINILMSNYGGRKQKGGWNTGDVFGMIIEKTPVLEFVKNVVISDAGKVILELLNSKKSKKDFDHYVNGLLGCVKRGYMIMAGSRGCSEKTAKSKGHNAFYMRTGQTMKALKGILVKK